MEQITVSRLLANISYNLIIKHRVLWILLISSLVVLSVFGLEDHQVKDFQRMLNGQPKVQENLQLILFAISAVFILPLIYFKNLSGAISTLTVSCCSGLLLFRSLGWAGIPISTTSLFVLPLILALSTSYSVHFLSHFDFFFKRKGEPHRLQALHYAFGQTAIPTFWAALGTGMGFTSLLAIPDKTIRIFAGTCLAATLLTFLLAITMVPILCSLRLFTQKPPFYGERPKSVFPKGMIYLSQLLQKKWIPSLLLALLALCLAILFFTKEALNIAINHDLLLTTQDAGQNLIIPLFAGALVFFSFSAAILRSFRAALLTLMPPLCSIAYIILLITLFKDQINLILFVVAPIVLAITIDCTVQFSLHFKNELFGFREYPKANQQTFMKIGHALILNFIVYMFGFGGLVLSSSPEVMTTGLLTLAGLILSYGSLFSLLPIAMVSLKPFSPKAFLKRLV